MSAGGLLRLLSDGHPVTEGLEKVALVLPASFAGFPAEVVRSHTAYLESLDPGTVDLCLPPAALVTILNDTIHHGAKRVARDSPAARERFVADQIRVAERLIGF